MARRKPWDYGHERPPARRKLRRYLIVAEDEKSGADYIRAFKVPKNFAELITIGGQGNVDALVQKALSLRQIAIYKRMPYSRIWCVIDRDSFPKDKFNRAFELVRNYRELTVIWANECFELWYLLHSCYRDTGIGRHEISRLLGTSDYLGRKYDKTDVSIFQTLQDKMRTAIGHAERLEEFYGTNLNPAEHNPSTNIHHLVKDLLKLQEAVAL